MGVAMTIRAAVEQRVGHHFERALRISQCTRVIDKSD